MTNCQSKTFQGIVVLLFLLCANIAIAGSPYARGSLTGITGIQVVVEGFSAEANNLGFDPDVIKTAAELRLRRSGVKVDESLLLPYLYINVNLVPISDNLIVAYNASVEFNQLAKLIANEKTQIVTTWQRSNTGGVGVKNVHAVRRHLDDLLDAFINDFLAANQK